MLAQQILSVYLLYDLHHDSKWSFNAECTYILAQEVRNEVITFVLLQYFMNYAYFFFFVCVCVRERENQQVKQVKVHEKSAHDFKAFVTNNCSKFQQREHVSKKQYIYPGYHRFCNGKGQNFFLKLLPEREIKYKKVVYGQNCF